MKMYYLSLLLFKVQGYKSKIPSSFRYILSHPLFCPDASPGVHRKDYSGEYTVLLIPCTVQPTQPWIDPGDKPLSCTAHAPEKYVPTQMDS